MKNRTLVYSLVQFFAISIVLGIGFYFLVRPVQAGVNCNKYLEAARVSHESGENSLAVPKSMNWDLDGIYNLQRYQICRQYGE